MIPLIITLLIAAGYVQFSAYCKAEWEMEDSLFSTEGTGHD